MLSSFWQELCTSLDASHRARGWGTSSRESWNQTALDENAFPPPWKHIWKSYSEQHELLGSHGTSLCSRNQQLEKGNRRYSSLGRENSTTSGRKAPGPLAPGTAYSTAQQLCILENLSFSQPDIFPSVTCLLATLTGALRVKN